MAGKSGICNVAGMRRRKRGGRYQRCADSKTGLMLGKLRNRWLQRLAIHGYSNSTITTYRWGLSHFIQWSKLRGFDDPSGITRESLEDFQIWLYEYRKINGQPLSSASKRARIGVLKRFFEWLLKQGHISVNPAEDLRMPRRPHRSLPKVLSENEIKRLLQQPRILDPLGLRNRAILELFYASGIRRIELVNLNIEDMDSDSGSLLVREGKGGKDRVLPLAKRTIRWLNAYLYRSRPKLVLDAGERAFFVTGYGGRYNPNYLGNWVRKTFSAVGITKQGACHLLRHSCATHMFDNGADLRCIQHLLGHSRLDTTQIYTEVSIRHLREVYNSTHPSALQ